jgi:hypothetical protein
MYAAILLRYIMPDALWADASSLNGKPQAKASAHAAAAAAAASDMSGAPPPVPSIADVSMASPTSPDATGGPFARVVKFVCAHVHVHVPMASPSSPVATGIVYYCKHSAACVVKYVCCKRIPPPP